MMVGRREAGEAMRCAKGIAILVAATIAATPIQAIAGGGPPKSLLRSGGRNLQKGNLGSYCWSHWSPGKGGTGICADADGFDFPSRVLVSAGDSVRIRLHHP